MCMFYEPTRAECDLRAGGAKNGELMLVAAFVLEGTGGLDDGIDGIETSS